MIMAIQDACEHTGVHMKKKNQNLLTCCARSPARSFIRSFVCFMCCSWTSTCEYVFSFSKKKIPWKENPEELMCMNKSCSILQQSRKRCLCMQTHERARSRSCSNLEIEIDRPIRFERSVYRACIYLGINVSFVIFMLHHPISIWIPVEERNQTEKKKIVDRNTLFWISSASSVKLTFEYICAH